MSYEKMLKQAKKTGKVYEGILLAENIKKERKEIENVQIRNRCRKYQSQLFL